MGGGPPNADVVRSSCIVTFPEETLAEPVPVDAWYLHAVGRTFLRRLARDRVGESMRIALVMQPVSDEDEQYNQKQEEADEEADEDEDGATQTTAATEEDEQQMQETAKPKRYISVGSDEILRSALQETFDHPDKVLVLHVISLEKVVGVKSIHVRPEINPNVSPEPVAPMGMVFPTLHVEGVTRVPAVTGMGASLMAMSSSYSMSKSVYVPPLHKGSDLEGKTLAHSTSFVEEREYTWRGAASNQQQQSQETQQDEQDEQNQHQEQQAIAAAASDSTEKITQAPPASAHHSQLSAAKQIEDIEDTDMSDIPMARVIGLAEPSPSSSESDYVMLELQTGAGFGETPSSTYFISSMWHVQAEEMSASMRLESSATPAPATWRRQQDIENESGIAGEVDISQQQQQQQSDRAAPAAFAVGLEESFVMLEPQPK